MRLTHLSDYLASRIGRAQYVLVAEAVGYQGAKFSGVPLTSERILLGGLPNIRVTSVLPYLRPLRTSNPRAATARTVRGGGYAEPTATIVWGLLQQLSLSPLDIILWNMFPFHPFRPASGRLSNRTPRAGELTLGRAYLDQLIALCPPGVKTIAIGEKAAATIGGGCLKVRHPANGGAGLFREQLLELVSP